MKKILVAEALKRLLQAENSFLNRTDIKVFTASTNDEILAVHLAEKVDLIISRPDMPGIKTDQLFAHIRNDRELRKVALIMLCDDGTGNREMADRCKPNSLLALTVDAAHLLETAQGLLGISRRESYRVLLSVSVAGASNQSSFFCKSENISTTGLLIETDRVLREGDRVKCSFFLPGSKQILAVGEVMRSLDNVQKAGGKRYGVRFEKLMPEAKAAIEAYVETKAHGAHPETRTSSGKGQAEGEQA